MAALRPSLTFDALSAFFMSWCSRWFCFVRFGSTTCYDITMSNKVVCELCLSSWRWFLCPIIVCLTRRKQQQHLQIGSSAHEARGCSEICLFVRAYNSPANGHLSVLWYYGAASFVYEDLRAIVLRATDHIKPVFLPIFYPHLVIIYVSL